MSQVLFRNLNEQFVQYRRDITYRTQVGVCVSETMKKRGYTRSQDTWDIFWAEKELLDSVYHNHRIGKQKRLNHFRSFHEICRKDNLNRNLKKHRRILQREGKTREASEYNFFPQAYHLPIEYAIFVQEFKKANTQNRNNCWIMKPTSRSQGKGIFIFNRLSGIQDWAQNPEAQTYICQKYIENPLLIGHKKFDLRLYVLCTSYRPLNIYLYREGFARFTHFRYDENNITSNQIHLTNVAIQKNTSEYIKDLGGKWMLSNLKHYLLSKNSELIVNACFYEINSMIVKTLKSVSKVMSNEPYCFELYGFDVMLDDKLKPWLLEVNGSPSMRANTKKDKELKCGLIDDVLTIVDLEQILSGKEDCIGGFDMICRNDSLTEFEYYAGSRISMLGCKCDRVKNYRQLATNLNTHHKNNEKKKYPECQSPISPMKKGFSVRKQKRTSSLMKPQESPTKQIALDLPKPSIRNTMTRRMYESSTSQL